MDLKEGFTLIELMVVIAVISILVATLTPQITDIVRKARVSAVASDIRALKTAQEALHTDTGEYVVDNESGVSNSPTLDETNLMFNVCGSSTWQGPYYEGSLTDAFDGEYRWDNDATACAGGLSRQDFNNPDCGGTSVFISGGNWSNNRAQAVDETVDDGDLSRLRFSNGCGYMYSFY